MHFNGVFEQIILSSYTDKESGGGIKKFGIVSCMNGLTF